MNRRGRFWLPVLLLASLTVIRAEVPVLRDNRILLPVLVASGAAPEERAAAEELARVLGQMAGRPWPVRPDRWWRKGIHVGTSGPGPRLAVATDLLAPRPGETGPDGFRIHTSGQSIFIEGAASGATGYAVSWLLQHTAGVRWYVPGPGGEVIPRRREFSFPDLDITRQPAYVSRDLYELSGPEGKTWGRRNGLGARLEFSHALGQVIPPAVLAEHPDWAPLWRGQRYQPASATDFGWQPNLALPAVADFAAQAAGAAFRHDPGRASFSLAMNDTLRFDQGPETRALVEPLRYFRGKPDYSPLVFGFMNRAAESLALAAPGHYLGCLAYFWCENPPPFRVHPQVLPYVTTDRTQYYNEAYRAADLDLMSRWGASGVRAFGLWEYGEGGNFLIPRVPVGALAEAVREGWRRGARGYFAEVGPQWGFDAFKLWALAQLMWDPERPLAELADDFYAGYYGAAAGPMRKFFERCEAQWMAQAGAPYWLKFYQQEDQALLFPEETCRELRALLATAGQVTADNPVVAARVDLTARAFAVTEAYGSYDACRRRLVAAGGESPDVPLDEESLATDIRELLQKEVRLRAAFADAGRGALPAMSGTNLAYFVRNDPVPRLLWLAARRDKSAPRRLLGMAGEEAREQAPWRELAAVLAGESAGPGENLVVNGSFAKPAAKGLEPRWLNPRSDVLPADWEVWSVPTETDQVRLAEAVAGEPGRVLRLEGSWDAQVFQWRPAVAGRVYIATARLRGKSSPGNDSALFMTFLSASGQVVGTHRMQSLPKGETPGWRTAVLADLAPDRAAWVGVGIGASRQVPGDWLEAGAMELRGSAREAAP